MQLSSLLKRAGDETTQEIVGRPTLKLLKLLDYGFIQPQRLRELITQLHGETGLLLSKKSRDKLFELLSVDEASQLATILRVSPANGSPATYAALQATSFGKGSRREQQLLNFFSVDVPEDLSAVPPPARQDTNPEYPLFGHQRRAAREVHSELSRADRRVLLHMPTGAGKTRTAMNVIAEHLRATEPGLVVWFAYSEELCEQAAQEFERAWAVLGNRKVSVHRFWGGNAFPEGDIEEGIVIAGLAKTYSLARRTVEPIGRLGKMATLVVMDEAHQAVADTYKLVLKSLLVGLQPPGLLGLSATPGRSWSDIEADEELADFFARRKVTLTVPEYDSPVDYLIDEGYLARPDFQPLPYDSEDGISPADLEKIQASLDIPASVLQSIAEDEMRNLVIVSSIEDLLGRHKRVIVFGASVWHAELLSAVLSARGFDSSVITGSTPSSERAARIERFKEDSDDARVLCNYGVLTTGFDAPRTSAALIARPTRSLVLYSQMVGRAIRGPRAGGNEKAEIVTVVDSQLPGFGNVSDAFLNWEDVWD